MNADTAERFSEAIIGRKNLYGRFFLLRIEDGKGTWSMSGATIWE